MLLVSLPGMNIPGKTYIMTPCDCQGQERALLQVEVKMTGGWNGYWPRWRLGTENIFLFTANKLLASRWDAFRKSTPWAQKKWMGRDWSPTALRHSSDLHGRGKRQS
jgi:hypothetical protein